ncbi:phosphoglycerate dehydrogenase-like enzyme [Tamaricihabitans halophyticus]|uniref:Phosphoglycerate dehydrogenase-like enzyme n=1 Tax=Tamaricihabitans halophyticus TaxID=1262583 RepID=A0A4R2R3N9_9PSEU|nr:phosphoglycerate dehydrogenase-like enzyme [Tamaricihabitans halophyticus]
MITVAVPEHWRAVFFARDELGTLGEVTVLPQDAPLPPETRVLVTGWGAPVLSAELLAGVPDLELVAHTGGTVKPFVTDAVWARGIRVTQAGEAMAYAVGEAALASTLALLHQLPRFDHALHTGASWQAAKAAPPRNELAASTVGVLGASRTGRHYLRLVRALGAEVLVADPYLSTGQARELGARHCELDELLASSAIVAVHAPVLPETRHLLGARELALLPDGAGLVNTARSWLVDQDALLAELRSGRIDAALDVFDEEPLPAEHPFRGLPNVLLTPHEAAGTRQARRRQGGLIVAEVARFLRGETLKHEVRATDLARMG